MNTTDNLNEESFDPFFGAPVTVGVAANKNENMKSDDNEGGIANEIALLRDLQEFRKKYAIINRTGKTYICWEDTYLQSLEFQNIVDFHNFNAHHYHFVPQGKAKSGKSREDKKVLVTQAFLEDKQATRYEGIVFDPSETCGKKYWNLWRGFKVQPKQGDISLFLDLIAALCNDDQTCIIYLLNYLAHMVQKPAELPEVAIVMRGAQGIGKGSLMKTISGFTDNYKHLSSTNSLTGQFNGHLLNAFVIFADEAVWGGDKSAEGRLKAMITEGVNSINDKAMSKVFAFDQDNPKWRSNWKSKTQGYFYQLPSKTECMKRFAKNICNADPTLVFYDYDDEYTVESSDDKSNVVNFQKQA